MHSAGWVQAIVVIVLAVLLLVTVSRGWAQLSQRPLTHPRRTWAQRRAAREQRMAAHRAALERHRRP
jgi:hypothetical protein